MSKPDWIMQTPPQDESPSARLWLGNVLILAYYYPPHSFVGALRPYRFAKYLPAYGFSTHVITASRQNAGAPANIHYVRDRIQDRSGLSGRVARKVLRLVYDEGGDESLAWVPAARTAAGKIIESSPGPWSVLSTFPPLSTHLTALWLKKRYGSKLRWIADFRDPMAQHSAARGSTAFWKSRLEPVIFRSADHLIANTDTVADRWRARYPQWTHKISHIWNGYDPEEEVKPLDIPPCEYKTIGHIGEIYGGRHPHLLLESLARLLDAGEGSAARTRLELTGDLDWRTIPDPGLLESLVQRGIVAVSNPKWTAAENRRAMACVDALLLLDVFTGLHVPSKLYVYLRIGRPILAITGLGSPAERILARSGVPYVCLYPEDSAAEVDAKVIRFLEMPSDPVPASEWFFREFDGVRQTGSLAAILADGVSVRAAPEAN
jgi:hypothetical protein